MNCVQVCFQSLGKHYKVSMFKNNNNDDIQRAIHTEYSVILQSLYELRKTLLDPKQNRFMLKEERDLIHQYNTLISKIITDFSKEF